MLIEELDSPSVTNIGIVVDANQVGAPARISMVQEIVERKMGINLAERMAPSPAGCTVQVLENLRIGVWVMPDNENIGYLEHFIEKLIPEKDPHWQFVNQKIEELENIDDLCRFSPLKKQKALVHTYLSWQENPGLSFGTAVKSNVLSVDCPAADNFVQWFQNAFILEGHPHA